MTAYESLTVVEIRAQFKARGIPATGLTRKQQLIDRLLEVDAANKQETEAEKVEPHDQAAEADEQRDAQAVEDVVAAGTDSEDARGLAAQASEITPAQGDGEHADKTHGGAAGADAPEPLGQGPKDAIDAQPEKNSLPLVEDAEAVVPAPITQETSINPASTSVQSHDEPATAQALEDPASASAEIKDSRKRKRRSLTPDVQEEEIAIKRRRSSEGPAEDAVKAEGGVAELNHTQPTKDTVMVDAPSIETTTQQPQEHVEFPVVKETEKIDIDGAPDIPAEKKTVRQQTPPLEDAQRSQPKSPKDIRYKDLFSLPAAVRDTTTDYPLEDRQISPSLHPATSALYIRNLKRPLQPQALKAHLEVLAQPPSGNSPTSPITAFHLDNIRTHALTLFTSPAAAARVRAALHASVWPLESTREPLWVDFVPEESVEEWIEIERSSSSGGRASGTKRWEVVYEEGVVRLQEVSGSTAPPTGPRASFAQPTVPPPRIPTPEVQRVVEAAKPAPFLALDSLFKSTDAKPKLYFLPVSAEVAEKRLGELDSRIRHNESDALPGGSGYRDSRRYTFEDGKLVDGGPEFGLRMDRGGPPGRGGRGGGRWRGR